MDVATPSVHEPVLFQTARDPLGASYLGWYLLPYVVGFTHTIGELVVGVV